MITKDTTVHTSAHTHHGAKGNHGTQSRRYHGMGFRKDTLTENAALEAADLHLKNHTTTYNT